MKTINVVLLVAGYSLLAACASVDAQDRFLLGEASRTNVAVQAARDVNLPNSRKVESTSGVRAVNAAKALNEGKTKKLAETTTGGAD